MSLETDIRTYLLAQSSVATLVGSRVYCQNIDQGIVLPALIIERSSGEHDHTLDGSSGFCKARVEIESKANTYVGARSLAEAVRLVLQGYRGNAGSTVLRAVVLDDDVDMGYTPWPNGSDLGFYQVSQTYLILFEEAAPAFS